MALTEHDVKQTRRAIALARKGCFRVEPNPPVGCVIERGDDGVVGEGWHQAWGGPHAEVGALRLAGEAARGATAYVSLAPCGVDAKTPACAGALLEAGIARVVFAAADPSPAENGAGIAQLRDAGVAVDGPIDALNQDAGALIERFRSSFQRTRPWTVLKWAMSLDGRISAARGSGGPISGRRAHVLVHDWRAHADAIAVGVQTVLTDDPQLTCRLEGGVPDGRAQPARVVFDGHLRTPPASRLVQEAGGDVIVFTLEGADKAPRKRLEEAGCTVIEVAGSADGPVDPSAALEALYERGVRRLLVEGGARLHGSMLRAGVADQVSAFVAPRILGGSAAVPAVEGSGIESLEDALDLEDVAWRRLGDDLLMQGYVPST